MSVDVRGRSVYLSAPMSGMPDYNRDKLNEAEDTCLKAGARRVYNPAVMIASGHGDQECMARDLETLLEMRRTSSNLILLQLPGWHRSAGCIAEWMVARQCGIECFEVSLDG